jgi:hypothetical protein
LFDILHALWRPLLISLLMAVLVRNLYLHFDDMVGSQAWEFGMFVAAGVLAYVAINWLLFPQLMKSYATGIVRS